MLHLLLFYIYIYNNAVSRVTPDGKHHVLEQIPPFDSYPGLLHFLIISIIVRSWYKLSQSWLGLVDVIQTTVIGYYYYFGDTLGKKSEDGDEPWISGQTLYNIVYYLTSFVIIARGIIYVHRTWILVSTDERPPLNNNENNNNNDTRRARDNLLERLHRMLNNIEDTDKSSDDDEGEEAAAAKKEKSFKEFKEFKEPPKKGRKLPSPMHSSSTVNRSPMHQIRRTPQRDLPETVGGSVGPWFGVISSAIMYIGLFVCLYQYVSKDDTVYADCWEVKQKGRPDGIYTILQDAKSNRTNKIPVSSIYKLPIISDIEFELLTA